MLSPHVVQRCWARQATVDEPTNENAWWTLVAILLQRADHAAVLPIAATLRSRFGATIDEAVMAGNDLWTAHFASEAYRTWRDATADASRPAPDSDD